MLRLLLVKTADFFLTVFDMTTMGHPCILHLETSRYEYIANNVFVNLFVYWVGGGARPCVRRGWHVQK